MVISLLFSEKFDLSQKRLSVDLFFRVQGRKPGRVREDSSLLVISEGWPVLLRTEKNSKSAAKMIIKFTHYRIIRHASIL